MNPQPVNFTALGRIQGQGTSDFVRNKKRYFIDGISSFPGERAPVTASTINLSDTYFLNDNGNKLSRNGDVVMFPADTGAPYRSADGAKTMSRAAGLGGLREFCYVGSNKFLGVNYVYQVGASTDNGQNWSAITLGVAGVTTPRYIDYCNGYALITQETASTTAAKSSDGGSTWSSVTLPFAAGRVKTMNNRLTVWVTNTNQIARATSDDLTSWETTTTPTNFVAVGFGGGKYIYSFSTGGVTYIYQSVDFQNWTLLWSINVTHGLRQDILYDGWSKNFIVGTSDSKFYYGFNTFIGVNRQFVGMGLCLCSNEDNTVMIAGVGSTGIARFENGNIREPDYATITY